MRNKPPETAPKLGRKTTPDRIIMERDYRLLTPLFGGGVIAGEVDTETPIHATGIRGQLRFWWRATQAGRFSTVAEMKKVEDALWGSTTGASAVQLAVIKINTGRAFQARNNQGQPVDIGATNSPYLYVAFPLQQSGGRVFEDVTFTLSVSLPSDDEALVEQVRAAFWAWDTFGGVGARTRRGFGALSCQMPRKAKYSAQFEPRDWHWEYDARRANTKLMADVRQLVVEGRGPADVPKLSRLVTRYKLTSLNPSEMAVWTYLFGALKAFRQSSQRQYGRSDWPDPQAIREATGQKSPQHANPVHNFLINKFPRARFGLPIIFEFKNGATDASARGVDPRKTMVSLAGRSRLASPLIIRPLAVSGGQFAGLALILDGNRIPPKQLELQEIDRTKIDDANHTLSEDEAREISRLHDTTITPDILQSFLDSLS